MNILDAIKEATRELEAAQKGFPAMRSGHEGYAILKEEVDELWEEIKRGKTGFYGRNVEKEAAQVAAMALRFLIDLC